MAMMKDYALAYYDHGWVPVPVTPGEKAPTLVAWGPFQRKRPTREQVAEWWGKWPDANIAILTGDPSGVDVVDVDVKTKGDPKPFQGSTQCWVNTPSGGWHFYYITKKLTSRAGVLQGVDVRGNGGYVLAPPSRIKGVGGYVWGGEPVTRVAPQAMPSKVFHLVAPKKAEEKKATVVRPTENWLAGILTDGVGEGGRNSAAAKLAGYFLSKGMPRDVVVAALDGWNSKNQPPLEYEELGRIVTSIAAKEEQRAQEVASEASKMVLYSFEAFMQRFEGREKEWLIEGWLPAATIGMILGEPRAFKTWTSQDLALSVATGQPFLGTYPVARPGPVLMIQEEDSPEDTAGRMGPLSVAKYYDGPADFYDVPTNIPLTISPMGGFTFEDEVCWTNLHHALEALRPSLVMFDPLYIIASYKDWFAGCLRHINRLKRLRDIYKTTFLIVHHTRKPTGEKKDGPTNPLHEMYGSQLLVASTETVWSFSRKPLTNNVVVSRHFKAGEDLLPTNLHFDVKLDRVPIMVVTESEPEVKEEKSGEERLTKLQGEVLEEVRRNKVPVTAELVSGVLDMNKGTILNALRQLAQKGFIEGNNSHGWSVTKVNVEELL